MKDSKQTRRRFLQYLTALPAGLWALGKSGSVASEPQSSAASSSSGARVIVATRASAAENAGKVNGGEVAKLLNDSMVAATGKADARSAWKSLFSPGDVVGIKVNCLAGRGLSSHPELAAAIVEGLSAAGLSKDKIIVWDRTEHDLESAAFSTNGLNGAKVLATNSQDVGYETSIEFSGEVGSCFSRILSRMCTAIINVPVLKDHDLAGVTLGMKNFYGAIHNPNKYHDNNCDPYVADLCAHPFIAKKLKLVVCDGLKAQYHGGPAPRAEYSWPAGCLIVGTDPVAVDRVGYEIIEQKRKEAGMQPLKEIGREPKYLRTAAKTGLGIFDIERITRVAIS